MYLYSITKKTKKDLIFELSPYCLSQRGHLFLGQIRQNDEAKTQIGPPLSDRALYSDKACSFNQSERALYRNFIINLYSTCTVYTVS